ncbi:MAG: epoxide hydrolase [Acidimicrobiia bacterium]|nr:epoxide hydrolase [Acidimicrobiia bacterium]
MPDSEAISPMRVEVTDDVLDDLRTRLRATLWPDAAPGAPWEYGTDLTYLRDLCEYWADGYDWRAAEQRLNTFDHFTTTIDGQNIHFVHAPSPEPDAEPLVITHGWPGSVVEFLDVIGPLSNPVSYGGDAADAFHVVAPSIPGYAWSGPTTEPGWDSRRVAEAWATLMDRLGYTRYSAQGGDWGSLITTELGLVDSAHLTGIHLNMAVCGPPANGGEMTDAETAAFARVTDYLENGSGYAAIQGTKPQTLSYGLTDSPAGLAGWILEKFHAWTDHEGNLETAVGRDDLLTNLMTYWVTGTINSSTRLYYESKKAGRLGPVDERVEVPTAVARYPYEILTSPRSWLEAAFNLRRVADMPRGGHFAAFEEPDLFVADVREAFADLRS